LVRLPSGGIAALDPTIFGNQGSACQIALKNYQATKKTIQDGCDDGSYVSSCLKDSEIESSRLTIGGRSKSRWPVFDLITEKGFIFAENILVHNCDYAINPIILSNRMVLPPGGLFDSQFDGISAEEVHARRQQQPPPQRSQQGQTGGSGDGPEIGKSDDEKEPDQQQDQEERQPEQREEEQDRDFGCGEVRDCEGEDAATQEAEWQVAVLQAAQAAKAQGKLPAGIERLVEEIRRPKIDWRAALRRFVQMCAKQDFTWAQPNRRYVASGLYLPAL
jgi:hypothetical protein